MILKRSRYRPVTVPLPSRDRPVTATVYRDSPSATVTHHYHTVQHRYMIVPHRPSPSLTVPHRPSPSLTVPHRSGPSVTVTLKNSETTILVNGKIKKGKINLDESLFH